MDMSEPDPTVATTDQDLHDVPHLQDLPRSSRFEYLGHCQSGRADDEYRVSNTCRHQAALRLFHRVGESLDRILRDVAHRLETRRPAVAAVIILASARQSWRTTAGS